MPEPKSASTPTDEAVMDLLHEHVPLTLLVDLAEAPASELLLAEEGLPEEPWWEPSDGATDVETD